MLKIWWRIRLAILLIRYRYEHWHKPLRAYQWAGEECWIEYFNDGFSPSYAIEEDLSYQ